MGKRSFQLTLPQQNYLETIHELCQRHGHAHSKAIAAKLKVTMASVTEAVQGLATLGLVNYRLRKAITLTVKGKRMAIELETRHRVLAEFFNRILGCTKKRADELACRVEHVVDKKFITRLEKVSSLLKDSMARHHTDSILDLPDLNPENGD